MKDETQLKLFQLILEVLDFTKKIAKEQGCYMHCPLQESNTRMNVLIHKIKKELENDKPIDSKSK